MARRRTQTISGSYQLLLHVPKHTIVDRLLDGVADGRAMNAAFRDLTGKSVTVTRTHLVGLSIHELTRLFEAVSTTNENDARELHDAWRYRGMKSLYLYRYAGPPPSLKDLVNELNNALATAAPVANSGLRDTDSQLQFDAIEEVHLASGTLVEIRYRSVAVVNYIDPADEEAKSVEDLRHGFVWISAAEKWAAISARDLDTRDRIADCLRTTNEATLSALIFSKDVVARLENQSRPCTSSSTGART